MIIQWTYGAIDQTVGFLNVFNWSTGAGGVAPAPEVSTATAFPTGPGRKPTRSSVVDLRKKIFQYDKSRGADWPYKF